MVENINNEDYFCDREKVLEGGIDSNLLVGDFKEMEDTISCPICLNILLDPICCKSCSLPMCSKCCKDWVSKNNSCPNRCKSFVESPLDRLASKFLSSIKLKCANHEQSCDKILSYDNFISHLLQCEFTNVTCKSCFKHFPSSLIKNHLNICEEKPIFCEKCLTKIKRKNLFDHNEKFHTETSICKYCGIKIKATLVNSHLNLCDKYDPYSKNCSICDELIKNNNHTEDGCLKKLKENYNNVIKTNKILEEKLSETEHKTRLLEFKNENLVNEISDLKNNKTKIGLLKSKLISYIKYLFN